jgi:hypothetical protein
MDEIFSLEKNPNLPMAELTAMLEEFRRWVGAALAWSPLQTWAKECKLMLVHAAQSYLPCRTAARRAAQPALPPTAATHPVLLLSLPATSTRLPPPALPRRDYNQRHFVRNEAFRQAADKLQGSTRRVFIEFLERACTAGRWVVVAWECMAGS